ncbi:hypothetical protein Q8A73_011499 [Channa argus]|nr:hypothetical protein Q8A73_011499 [Channa argus]
MPSSSFSDRGETWLQVRVIGACYVQCAAELCFHNHTVFEVGLWGFCQALDVTRKHSCPVADSSRGTHQLLDDTRASIMCRGRVQAGCQRVSQVSHASCLIGLSLYRYEATGRKQKQTVNFLPTSITLCIKFLPQMIITATIKALSNASPRGHCRLPPPSPPLTLLLSKSCSVDRGKRKCRRCCPCQEVVESSVNGL